MDVQINSFVIPTLISLWKLTPADAGLLATCTLLFSAFGGWLTGILADRYGRVLMLQITIAWFAGFTFLQGLSAGFAWLLVARSLQGLGFGGEWAAGSVLAAETIRSEHRGKAVGAVQSSWSIGWGMAALLATLFFQLMPQEFAWRALFFVGILPALLISFVRRSVPEPEIYTEQGKVERRGDPLAIFGRTVIRRTALGALLAVGAPGGYYAITTWLPTFLQKERGLTILSSGGYLAVIIVGSFIGYLVSAYLSDLIGRRSNFILFAICSVLVVVIYTEIPINDSFMLVLGFPLGFFASGVFSGMGAFFTELFPTEIRGNAQGFCYNFGRVLAAGFPLLVGLLSARLPLGQAIGIYAAGAYLLMVIAALALPETRGKNLRENRLVAGLAVCSYQLSVCGCRLSVCRYQFGCCRFVGPGRHPHSKV
jgi:MFS family permease